MTIEPIGVLTILIGFLMLVVRTSTLGLYAITLATLLGAAAVLKLPALGDASLLPAHFLILFLTTWTFARPDRLKAAVVAMNYPGPGFWLCALTVFGLISAIMLPRIFAGQTLVFSLARGEDYIGIISTPLTPRASNFTQTAYLFVNLACFACFASAARLGEGPTIAKALVAAGAASVAFALLDVATYATKTAQLMSFVRNANYRMLADGEILGLKRIVGSFAEAGAYGFAAVGLYAFSLRLWLQSVWTWVTGPIAGALLLTIALCTSTTAYVALGGYSLALWIRCLAQTINGRAGVKVAAYAFGTPFAALMIGLAVLLNPTASDAITSLFDATVVNKLETQSGQERMNWNTRALESFVDTEGLGAGLGSVRASSFIVSSLSNIGIVGTLLYAVYLFSLLKPMKRAESLHDKIRVAAGSACCVQLLAACISAGGIDLGLMFCLFAALAATPDPIAHGARATLRPKRVPFGMPSRAPRWLQPSVTA